MFIKTKEEALTVGLGLAYFSNENAPRRIERGPDGLIWFDVLNKNETLWGRYLIDAHGHVRNASTGKTSTWPAKAREKFLGEQQPVAA